MHTWPADAKQNAFRQLAIRSNPHLFPPHSPEYLTARQRYEALLRAYRVLRNGAFACKLARKCADRERAHRSAAAELRRQYDAGTLP